MTTYTIRRPGNTSFCSSPSLHSAISDCEIANRTCAPGHRIYRERDGKTSEVSQDEIESHKAEHAALRDRTSMSDGIRMEDAVELGYRGGHSS